MADVHWEVSAVYTHERSSVWARAGDGKPPICVAETWGPGHRSNAFLVAAAPELHEALRAMVSAFAWEVADDTTRSSQRAKIVDEAKAALAKVGSAQTIDTPEDTRD